MNKKNKQEEFLKEFKYLMAIYEIKSVYGYQDEYCYAGQGLVFQYEDQEEFIVKSTDIESSVKGFELFEEKEIE